MNANVSKSIVMKCSRDLGGRQLNVVFSEVELEEVHCFKNLGSVILAEGDSGKVKKSRVN